MCTFQSKFGFRGADIMYICSIQICFGLSILNLERQAQIPVMIMIRHYQLKSLILLLFNLQKIKLSTIFTSVSIIKVELPNFLHQLRQSLLRWFPERRVFAFRIIKLSFTHTDFTIRCMLRMNQHVSIFNFIIGRKFVIGILLLSDSSVPNSLNLDKRLINLQQYLTSKLQRSSMTLFFNEMLTRLSFDCFYKKIIVQAEKKYCVKQLNLQILSPAQVINLLNKQGQQQNPSSKDSAQTELNFYETSWALNQFKLFAWMSVCYAYFLKKDLQQFVQEDFKQLSLVFPRKSKDFLEYYIRSLLKQYRVSRVKWTEDQTSLLAEAIREQQGNTRWSQISIRLFTKSNKRYFRTAQKCREKWFNHLDPQVLRSKWSQEEDLKLFSYINKYGTKWALISKLFNGVRTEHMVKNRYNSVVKRYQYRSQKSLHKIIDKIMEDLQRCKKHVEHQQISASVKAEEEVEAQYQSEAAAQQSLFGLQSQSRKQRDSEQIKWMGQAKTISSIDEGFLNSLDINELLFSDNTIEIERCCPKIGPIELVQIQFTSSSALNYSDQTLSSLLL